MTAAAVPAESQHPADPAPAAAERHLSAVPDPEPETDEREHIVLGYN
ncbi:hypothetical protein [Amycolatopsis lexingtonensis]